MKLTINRPQWLRGEGSTASRLVRVADDKMCCLGFYGLACGIPKAKMTNIQSFLPFESKISLPDSMSWLLGEKKEWSSKLGAKLMLTNDNEEKTNQDRESELIELFAQVGVELTFTDEDFSPGNGQV